jgi:hypothetical protein
MAASVLAGTSKSPSRRTADTGVRGGNRNRADHRCSARGDSFSANVILAQTTFIAQFFYKCGVLSIGATRRTMPTALVGLNYKFNWGGPVVARY